MESPGMKTRAQSELRYFLFWRAGWRKAECAVCNSVVRTKAVGAHAAWHSKRSDGGRTSRPDSIYSSHKIVSIDWDGDYWVTGWVTADTGPR